MKTLESDITENVLDIVKNLSVEAKQNLVDKINKTIEKPEQTNVPDQEWKDLFGAWDSDRSAEEIIKDIRSSRYSDRQIEEL